MLRRARRSTRLLLVLLLALSVALAVSPAIASASPTIQHTGIWYWFPTSGSFIAITGCDPQSGVLTVPQLLEVAAGDTRTVTEIYGIAFRDMTGLTEIILPKTVTTIGQLAFSGCTGLTRATIPVNVNILERGSFMYCTSLENVDLPSSLSSIGESAFEGCTSLNYVAIPDSVSTIGNRAFYGSGLQSAVVPQNVASIGNDAFTNSADLDEITFCNDATVIPTGSLAGTDLASGGIYGWWPSTAKDYADATIPVTPFYDINEFPPVLWADDVWDEYFDATLDPGQDLSLGGLVTTSNDMGGTVSIYGAIDNGIETLIDTVTLSVASPTDASLQAIPIIYSALWSGDYTLPPSLPGGYHYLTLSFFSGNSVWGVPQTIRFYVDAAQVSPTVQPTSEQDDDDNPTTGDPATAPLYAIVAVLALAVLLATRHSAKQD